MKKLLVVVDYQVDFVTGSLGFKEAELLDEKIAERIEEYHRNNDDVAFTFDTHNSTYLSTQEGKNLPIVHCLKGTEGHELYGKVKFAKKECDLIFEKTSFASRKLYDYLLTHPYSQIELCGVVSDICVISNVVVCKLAQEETPIKVDSSLVASLSEIKKDSSIEVMKSLQVEVI